MKEGLATTEPAKKCVAKPSDCYAAPPLRSAFDITTPWRTYVEMRVILKYVYLGADINNGEGGDDARFIGGVTVGLDRFFAK